MECIIPWKDLLEIISPFWYNQKTGRPRTSALLLLKIHFLQKWYHLADEAVEEALWENIIFQKFLDIDAAGDGVPDATTIENFRHCLEENNIAEQIFTQVVSLLSAR